MLQWITHTIWAVCCSPVASFVLKFFSTCKYSLLQSAEKVFTMTHIQPDQEKLSFWFMREELRARKGFVKKLHPLTHTHTQTFSEYVWEFNIMVDLMVRFPVYVLAHCLMEKQNILTVFKQGWIRRAVAAGTTAISIVLRWHVYCKRWPRTDDHSTKSLHDFGLQYKLQYSSWWIAMKFVTDVDVSQTMYPTYFGDLWLFL